MCSKSVHDFTKKTIKEIQTVLVEEMSAGNKVCGRFNEDQLSPSCEPIPALDAYSLNFTRLKKFALALFLVFGGFLFNSTKSTAQKIMGKMAMPQYHEPVRGEIAISKDPEPVLKDTARTVRDNETITPIKIPVKCRMPMKGDVMVEPIEKIAVLGQMVIEQPKVTEVIKGNAIIEQTQGEVIIEQPVVTGAVAIIEEPIEVTMGDIDILPIEEPITADTIITAVEDYPLMGVIVAMPYDIEEPIIVEPTPSDSILNIIDGEFAVEESTYVETMKGEEEINIPDEVIDINVLKIEVYPNPTSNGEITLRYNLKKDDIASIMKIGRAHV